MFNVKVEFANEGLMQQKIAAALQTRINQLCKEYGISDFGKYIEVDVIPVNKTLQILVNITDIKKAISAKQFLNRKTTKEFMSDDEQTPFQKKMDQIFEIILKEFPEMVANATRS